MNSHFNYFELVQQSWVPETIQISAFVGYQVDIRIARIMLRFMATDNFICFLFALQTARILDYIYIYIYIYITLKFVPYN